MDVVELNVRSYFVFSILCGFHIAFAEWPQQCLIGQLDGAVGPKPGES